jgi:hypothetical protein
LHIRSLLRITFCIAGCGATAFLTYWVAPGAALVSSYSVQAPPAAADSLTATVAAVDNGAQILEVITGVGHALAVVRLEVPPACRIMVAGTTRQLGDLRRGDIVDIRYRRIGRRNVADSIETIAPVRRGE